MPPSNTPRFEKVGTLAAMTTVRATLGVHDRCTTRGLRTTLSVTSSSVLKVTVLSLK
jgi:hypothetical protein